MVLLTKLIKPTTVNKETIAKNIGMDPLISPTLPKGNKQKIKASEFVIFTQQLTAMLKASLPILAALDAIRGQIKDPILKPALNQIYDAISKGASFSEAVRNSNAAFPPIFISMLEAGEASGAVAEIMHEASVYFSNNFKLIKKIKSALTYPIVIISFAVIAVVALLTFVVPVFSDMFSQFQAQLPLPTQILINCSNTIKNNIFTALLIGGFVFYGLKKYLATPQGRKVQEKLIHRIPIWGQIAKKGNIARFCRTYAALLKGGVPVLKSLQICVNAANSLYIEEACTLMAEGVQNGTQLSEILKKIHYFPDMVWHMAAAGEKTGNIDGMMLSAADFYETEINSTVDSLTSLLEPILIAFLGVIVGTIVVVMFLPIFQLSSIVGGGAS